MKAGVYRIDTGNWKILHLTTDVVTNPQAEDVWSENKADEFLFDRPHQAQEIIRARGKYKYPKVCEVTQEREPEPTPREIKRLEEKHGWAEGYDNY